MSHFYITCPFPNSAHTYLEDGGTFKTLVVRLQCVNLKCTTVGSPILNTQPLCLCRCVTRRHFSIMTALRVLSTMYALMSYKTALLIECFLTHITALRVLTIMYALMFYKLAILIESLLTHITDIRVPTTMYALMFY
jgi:hypothetical protein